MKHLHSASRPICELPPSLELIGDAARSIYGSVDCADCLYRAIAEGEERLRVLREVLGKLEVLS